MEKERSRINRESNLTIWQDNNLIKIYVSLFHCFIV